MYLETINSPEDVKKVPREALQTLADETRAALKADVKANGKYLDTLEYGADRYDYHGFSVVVNEDSMSQEENKSAVKYLILRPNGHLYSKWDSQASLIF